MRRKRGRNILFSMVAVLLVFTVFEVLLRISGIRMSRAPVVIERIMHSEIRYDWLVEDSQLFWKLRNAPPGDVAFRLEGDSRTGASVSRDQTVLDSGEEDDSGMDDTMEKKSEPVSGKRRMPVLAVAADRYETGPLPVARRPGVTRMICLGDSCTFFGHPSYPRRLEIRLNSLPGQSWEVYNAGVPGYTSYQGYHLFKTYLLKYRPDLVTVFFGWNDHWLASQMPDAAYHLNGRADSRLGMDSLLRHLRFYDLLSVMLFKVRHRIGPGDRDAAGGFRVPLDDFRHNMNAIQELAAGEGIHTVFLTAPAGFTPDNPPQYLEESGFFPDVSRLAAVHEEYNNVVRSITATQFSLCVDLEREMENDPMKPSYFLKDGIHYTPAGIERVSRIIGDRLLDWRMHGIMEETMGAELHELAEFTHPQTPAGRPCKAGDIRTLE